MHRKLGRDGQEVKGRWTGSEAAMYTGSEVKMYRK